ncbi:helix-turn-helix domain-containing protein [Amycolatopsis sp. NPDC051903]|uniref:helix-turn-helix domain-containing protein n=1 Tax=Amycolatopsis sp. NPDC051903 TaxID=3363936 RepID=UPI00379A45F6
MNSIGDFLRARRALVSPADVGLPDAGERRVPGLRREELAAAAGVSVDYYVRLEQGRDRHPSAQVLDALARALKLDEDGAAHLHRLVAPPRTKRGELPRGARELVERNAAPAVAWSHRMDVLAASPLAVALAPMYRLGTNLARAVFLDPWVRQLHPGWEAMARNVTAMVRARTAVPDPGLDELIAELTAASPDFARLWPRHDVRTTAAPRKVFRHPVAGELTLGRELLNVPGGEWTVLIYHAEPGSRSANALARLG